MRVPAFSKVARGESRRDRGPHLPHAARARDRVRGRLLRRRPRTRCTSRAADEAYLVGPGPAAESYLRVDRLLEAAVACRRGGRPPGLRVPGGERRRSPRGRERRARLDRPAPGGDRADGLEDGGTGRACSRRPGSDHPGHDRASRLPADEVVPARRGDRIPAPDQGRGRRRRQGDEGRRRRGGGGACLRVRAARGGEVLRRLVGLRRALPRGSAPRRGPGARRCARQRHPPRRARLHDPAPPPEARRGDAVAGGRRRAPRADRRRSPSTPPAPPAIARPGRSRDCSLRKATTSSWR